jgi:hypothetical protein
MVSGHVIYVYISTNSGGTFVKTNVSNSITEGVACSSADGTILMTAAPFGVDISTNAGPTWASEAGGNYIGETCGANISAQGNIISAKADDGDCYFDCLFGDLTRRGKPKWFLAFIICSADGHRFTTFGSSNIYTSFATPTPTLNLVTMGSNIAFSRLIPSTNFVLQQSLDLTMANWMTLANTPTLDFAHPTLNQKL